MTTIELAGGRQASYEVIGKGAPTLMFAGGPGFAAGYMRSTAELFSDVLRSHLIDPHGSGGSTPPPIRRTTRRMGTLGSTRRFVLRSV